jgi:peptidoglycan/xylan/chitin deacetylase (PgdA/CDA1 family)
VTADERRSARILFSAELANGGLSQGELERPEVTRAVRSRPVPPAWHRALQQVRLRQGLLRFERDCVETFAAVRRAVLGDSASGPPRVLVRVDEFPHARALDQPDRYGRERFERFHRIMRDAGVPYLLAVTPFLPYNYLNPAARGGRPISDEEAAVLHRVAGEGVTFSLHGWDHRTRRADPRRHSELVGLGAAELEQLLAKGMTALAEVGVEAPVFVPPFNRFDARQYAPLAARFAVVCGGPESVALVGYHRTPLWREGAVYLPAYAPFYARAGVVRPAVEAVAARGARVWLPVVLHWGWEADDGWRELERLARTLAPLAAGWHEFLGEAVADAPEGLPGDRAMGAG